jgi:hypothetical protein
MKGLGNYLDTAISQGVKVRILLPKDERSYEFENYLNSSDIELKQVDNIVTKRIELIIDNLHSLIIEINKPGTEALKSIIKNGSYSTSSIALMTFSVLFEKMWT